MREETICKICFNLLNDIDYHLKEAQEKTDDITNKFLDKEKDPLSYKPHQLIALSSTSSTSPSSTSTTTHQQKQMQHRKYNSSRLVAEEGETEFAVEHVDDDDER